MYDIAHGIDVYYENKKEMRNIVFLPDGSYWYYPTGAMLFEVIGDDASVMLTKKVLNMIRAFPDNDRELDADGVTDGFKWLYGTIEDEELPVATELFRGTFNEAITAVLERIDDLDKVGSVGDFLLECFNEYLDNILTFIEFLESVAAVNSGAADEFQKEVAGVFVSSADEMYETYTRKCSVRHKDENVSIQTHNITNFLMLLTFEYCRLKKENKSIKQCLNCGRVFIPPKRNDSIYCLAISPQRPDKTCSEITPQIRRGEKRRNDPREREHHKTACKLHNMVRRSKQNGDDEEIIDYYKKCIDAEMLRYSKIKEENSNE